MNRPSISRRDYVRLAKRDLAQWQDLLEKYVQDDVPPHVQESCKELIGHYHSFVSLAESIDTTPSQFDELSEKVLAFYRRTRWKGDFLLEYIDRLIHESTERAV